MSVSKNILKMFLIFFIINSVLKFLKESFSDPGGFAEWYEWYDEAESDVSTQADSNRAQADSNRAQAKNKDTCIPIGEGENCW